MKINLTDKDKSGVCYDISYFPDGQQNIKLNFGYMPPPSKVKIETRLTDFKDVEILLVTTAALKNLGVRLLIYIFHISLEPVQIESLK